MTDSVNLNLARKWRSRTFEHVVGQELSVRMLKNSLYLNHYFPVYLFSGQRGCGKTTTARIFAYALNCQQLEQFQKDPRSVTVPCLSCESCLMMRSGNHPDFIEIDAASHTGVDNVRAIIDASSLLPLMGRKKIYLIDEAHMLSKAAFNAFLKILEEPPCTVLFILATTDIHKIIDTIRSRSFQLFFRAVPADVLLKHLEYICSQESIVYDQQALHYIISNTDGCVRDALNLLEQVRFYTSRITKSAVEKVLGHCSQEIIVTLFKTIIQGSLVDVIRYFQNAQLAQYEAMYIWQALANLIRELLWLHYELPIALFIDHKEQLQNYVHTLSPQRIIDLLQLVHNYESILLKATTPHQSLEMMIIAMCQLFNTADAVSNTVHSTKNDNTIDKPTSTKTMVPQATVVTSESRDENVWHKFVASIASLNDPLLSSIFKHARFVSHDKQSGIIAIAFAQEFIFFQEWLEKAQQQWQPLLVETFGDSACLQPSFLDQKIPKQEMIKTNAIKPIEPPTTVVNEVHNTTVAKVQPKKTYQVYQKQSVQNKPESKKEIMVDTSNNQMWKKAQLLLQAFPGIIVEVKE